MTAVLVASISCDAPEGLGVCGRTRTAEEEGESFDQLAEACGFTYVDGIGWLCSHHTEQHGLEVPFTPEDDGPF